MSRHAVQPVISEFYDELVFNEPTEFFYKKLMAGALRRTRVFVGMEVDRSHFSTDASRPTGPDRQAPPHPLQEHFPAYSDVAVLKTLAQAQEFVGKEIQEAKDLLLHTDIELKELRERVAELTKKKKLADKSAASPAIATGAF